MKYILSNHPIVKGLYVASSDDISFYFNFVCYDSSESCLIFERESEVVTARVFMPCEQQLQVWSDAFRSMSIELEKIES